MLGFKIMCLGNTSETSVINVLTYRLCPQNTNQGFPMYPWGQRSQTPPLASPCMANGTFQSMLTPMVNKLICF